MAWRYDWWSVELEAEIMPLAVVKAHEWHRIESTGFLATRDVWLLPRSNRPTECGPSTISSDPRSGKLFSVTAERSRPVRMAACKFVGREV